MTMQFKKTSRGNLACNIFKIAAEALEYLHEVQKKKEALVYMTPT